jgi:hypothetical protein
VTIQRKPPRIATLSVGGVSTKLLVMSILLEELEDGSRELTVTGFPLGDSSNSELIPNALDFSQNERYALLAERDQARASAMQLHTIKMRFHDGQKPQRGRGRAGIPGRWKPSTRLWNFVAMQRLIDRGGAQGPTAASGILGLAGRPGDHHTLLTNYKEHRALLAAGNHQLLEMTVAAYAQHEACSPGVKGKTGYVAARTHVLAAIDSYRKNRRKRPRGE